MNDQIKNIIYNKSFVFTILVLFLIGGMFYWFAYRPTKIRHDCSWVRVVDPATPAEPAITSEDAQNSRLEYDKCIASQAQPKNSQGGRKRMFNDDGTIVDPFAGLFCGNLLKQERPPLPAKPEKVWYREVNKDEYNFCIHERGLK